MMTMTICMIGVWSVGNCYYVRMFYDTQINDMSHLGIDFIIKMLYMSQALIAVL